MPTFGMRDGNSALRMQMKDFGVTTAGPTPYHSSILAGQGKDALQVLKIAD